MSTKVTIVITLPNVDFKTIKDNELVDSLKFSFQANGIHNASISSKVEPCHDEEEDE